MAKPVAARRRGRHLDGAAAHRGKDPRAPPTARLVLPPYSPELNPAERVFEEVRRRVEGAADATLAAKQAAAEAALSAGVLAQERPSAQ